VTPALTQAFFGPEPVDVLEGHLGPIETIKQRIRNARQDPATNCNKL